MSLAARAFIVWFLILIAASANGGLREAWLIPKLGETAGRAISTVLLSGLVLLLTWFTIRWMHPQSARDGWLIGAFWIALTLAFEFAGGHYLFGKSWRELTEDYNLLRGRIWILVLLTTAVAPRLCAVFRGVG